MNLDGEANLLKNHSSFWTAAPSKKRGQRKPEDCTQYMVSKKPLHKRIIPYGYKAIIKNKPHLCHACFRAWSPHYHYVTPERTGGGWSILVKKEHQDYNFFQNDHLSNNGRVGSSDCESCSSRVEDVLGGRIGTGSKQQLYNIDHIISTIDSAHNLTDFLESERNSTRNSDRSNLVDDLRISVLEREDSDAAFTKLPKSPENLDLSRKNSSILEPPKIQLDGIDHNGEDGTDVLIVRKPGTGEKQSLSRPQSSANLRSLTTSRQSSRKNSRDGSVASTVSRVSDAYFISLEEGVDKFVTQREKELEILAMELKCYKHFAQQEIFNGRDFNVDSEISNTDVDSVANDDWKYLPEDFDWKNFMEKTLKKYLKMSKTHDGAHKMHKTVRKGRSKRFHKISSHKTDVGEIVFKAFNEDLDGFKEVFSSENELEEGLRNYVGGSTGGANRSLKKLYDEAQLLAKNYAKSTDSESELDKFDSKNSKKIREKIDIEEASLSEDELNSLVRVANGNIDVLDSIVNDLDNEDFSKIRNLAGGTTMFKKTVLAKAAEVFLSQKRLEKLKENRDVISRNKSSVVDFLVQRDSELLEGGKGDGDGDVDRKSEVVQKQSTIAKSPFGDKPVTPKSIGNSGILQSELDQRKRLQDQLNEHSENERINKPYDDLEKNADNNKNDGNDEKSLKNDEDDDEKRRRKMREKMKLKRQNQTLNDGEDDDDFNKSEFNRSRLSRHPGMGDIEELSETESEKNRRLGMGTDDDSQNGDGNEGSFVSERNEVNTAMDDHNAF